MDYGRTPSLQRLYDSAGARPIGERDARDQPLRQRLIELAAAAFKALNRDSDLAEPALEEIDVAFFTPWGSVTGVRHQDPGRRIPTMIDSRT